MYRYIIKPIFDFIIALIGLLMLSPIFLVVMIVLWFVNDGKPFFYQLRPGKGQRIFKIIKFKTMNDRCDASGQLLPDAERLTKIGSFIRKSSLDEIPQLLNILKGDMSLIGPRPLLIKYLPYYTQREQLRHTVRPGITGLAQINGRNNLNWDDRLELDVKYVKNLSLLLDVKILFKTIVNVILRKDIAVGYIDLDNYRTIKNE